MIPHVAGMGLATTVAPEAAAVEVSPNPLTELPPARTPNRGALPCPRPGRAPRTKGSRTERTGPMGENTPQDSGDERVIRTPQDLAAALTEQFLTNADSGDYAANDEMITQLREWKRKNR